jgi:hypothetical protein
MAPAAAGDEAQDSQYSLRSDDAGGRAAWGHPTRVSSSRSAWHQRDTWHYTGRRHNTDVIGGQTGGAQPLGEWTVAFANGWVVGSTD